MLTAIAVVTVCDDYPFASTSATSARTPATGRSPFTRLPPCATGPGTPGPRRATRSRCRRTARRNRSEPFCNLPKAHYHAYEIQALRTLGTMARGTGDAGGALNAAREITAWSDELVEFDIDDELAEPGLRALHVLADAVYATVGAC